MMIKQKNKINTNYLIIIEKAKNIESQIFGK